jgi:hypothetical protein
MSTTPAEHQPAALEREIDECANHLLVPRGFKQECVGNHLLAGLNSGENLLPVAVEHFAGMHFGALELVAAGGKINPIAIVQVKNGIGGNHRACLLVQAHEGSRGKHAQLEEAGIGTSMRTLAVRKRWIEHRTDVADVAGSGRSGYALTLNARFLAELQLGNVVLIDIAENPDAGEVGDGEGRGRAREVDARGGALVTFWPMMTPEMGA